MTEEFKMRIVESYETIDLIEVAPAKFCVRLRYRGLIPRWKACFYVFNRNGTDYTFDSLCTEITIGDFERARYIFNCNALKRGKI